jgi:hypothetical protein
VITPPATVGFDNEELELGANYTWNGGRVVPARFYETKLPVIVTAVGQAATIRMVAPIQYLEKMPDGSLKVREVTGNLPDIPHYALTLTAKPAPEAPSGYGYDLIVMCQMDIATMQGREKIPGIDLEVGRPITARFDKSVEFWGRKGEWFGILANQEESGGYALFLLLKISPEGGAPAPVTTGAQLPKVVKSDPTRFEISGYSVAAPAKRGWSRGKWLEQFTEGVVFQSGDYYMKSNRAGFSVMPAATFPNRKSFLNFVKQGVEKGSDTFTFGYTSLKHDFTEKEQNGLWLVGCSLNGEGGDLVRPVLTHVRILYATDPSNPDRVAVTWYAWRGSTLDDDARFEAEAAAFLGSLRKATK